LENILDFDEGLGTVYERFMLNDFFDLLIDAYAIDRVLEVPIYGMTGLTGINSVQFVRRGCKVTLVDSNEEKVDEAVQIWKLLPYEGDYEVLCHKDLSRLPFGDASFKLVWNFAALWYVRQVEKFLGEMARVSSHLVLIFVPNKKQIGYFFRKYLLDKRFFTEVDEKWVDTKRISAVLASLGMKLKDRGVLDIPPWPDTCVPIGKIFDKLGIKRNSEEDERNKRWTWDIMSYYLGRAPALKRKVERFSFLEKISLPWKLKALWAHHNYLLFSKEP
jgi:SAM-dependent methyltransferase